jgi:thymidylate synthase (FAD)
MARITVPEAEELLDKEFPVLDKGFVRLVDYMGSDARIVQSARVSYGSGTKTVREDQGLINYLIKNLHTSPLEQVELTFHIKAPLFVVAQWVRHRMASINSMSARYSVMKDEFYLPTPEQIRSQSNKNKQVGEGILESEVAQKVFEQITDDAAQAYSTYESLLEDSVCREQARMVLPQNLYTQFYWKQDLHNLFHFLRLRMDWHAQEEIRAYAKVMATMAQAVAPMAYAAFEEHILHAVRLSRKEAEVVRALLQKADANVLERSALEQLSEREKTEFLGKLGL